AGLKLEKAGKYQAALDAYLDAKEFEDAARMARQLGRSADAAHLFLAAGKPMEAAIAFHAAGDAQGCLKALIRVAPEGPQYREAVVQAVRIASRLNELDFPLDHFLAHFLKTTPKNAVELE